MNTSSCISLYRLVLCLLTAALLTAVALPARADSRQDAVAELERLHQPSSTVHLSDELKSAEATFAIAEHFFQTGDPVQAERFYLLTIQKARIIRAALQQKPTDLPLQTDAAPPLPAAPREAGPEPEAVPAITVTEPAESPAPAPFEAAVPPRDQEPELLPDDITSEKLVGTASTYSVVKGDTIRLISAKLGVSRQHLIRKNRLDEKAYLKIGQKLVYNNRKIVPQRMKNGIVVNIPDRTLYYFKQGRLAGSLPVALGVPVTSEKYDWKTPTGKFKVTAKMKDPTWHVPHSIQTEMEDNGKDVITSVPPGPTNPLGKYAIKTSIPGILIHSTTKPWSIYSFASHGCIRVYPEQMEEFFKEVTVNMPGEIIYKPVKLAVTENGRVFLEVHRDVYNKSSSGLAAEARRLIGKMNLSERVDWQKVESLVRTTSGIAEDVSL